MCSYKNIIKMLFSDGRSEFSQQGIYPLERTVLKTSEYTLTQVRKLESITASHSSSYPFSIHRIASYSTRKQITRKRWDAFHLRKWHTANALNKDSYCFALAARCSSRPIIVNLQLWPMNCVNLCLFKQNNLV